MYLSCIPEEVACKIDFAQNGRIELLKHMQEYKLNFHSKFNKPW